MSFEIMFAKKAISIKLGDSKMILNNAGQYCFIGGRVSKWDSKKSPIPGSGLINLLDDKVDSKDDEEKMQYVNAAIREFKEETGIDLNGDQYNTIQYNTIQRSIKAMF
ncbi:MAG: hypothetical protein O3C05_00750 [Proteobacteria bacterium]|nr:hypothetical protein [Pseudomonadota bacterium]